METGNGYSEQDTVASQDNLTIEAYNGEPVVDASSTSGSGVGFTIDASVTGVTISGLTIEKFVTGVAIFGSATIGGTRPARATPSPAAAVTASTWAQVARRRSWGTRSQATPTASS